MLISIVIKPRKKLDTIRQRGVTSTSINEMKLENVELLLFFSKINKERPGGG